jgi:protein-tyrosine phosphatase
MSCISLVPTNTIGKLYLGSISSLNKLTELDIKFVISLFPPVNCTIPKDVILVEYSISDTPQYKARMDSVLSDTTIDIRDRLVNGENILVHCFAGISRSATVVLDYLLTYELKDKYKQYDNVISYIRQFRECVKPNIGFAVLLSERHQLNMN